MTATTQQFWIDRIAATEAQIVAYEDAITALTTGGVQMYSLNTGQTVQSVTKLNLATLQAALDGLYNRLATLNARVYGAGRVNVRPDW